MAIDKSRTKPWMKLVIIFFCAALVLGIGSFAVEGLLQSAQISSQAGQSTSTTGSSADVTATVTAVRNAYEPRLKALEASASPNDPAAQLKIAEGYFEFADAVLQAVTKGGGDTQQSQQQGLIASAGYWQAASSAYAKSFTKKSGDASQTTDYSIATFYGGDSTGAIKIAEDLIAKDPTFAPARFNVAIFYANSGDTAKAKAALQEYLRLDPNGVNAAAAKQMLTQLK